MTDEGRPTGHASHREENVSKAEGELAKGFHSRLLKTNLFGLHHQEFYPIFRGV